MSFSVSRKRASQSEAANLGQSVSESALPSQAATKIARLASNVIANPYTRSIGALGNTQWNEQTRKTFKEITVGDKTYRGEWIGKGDSFQCYKCNEVGSDLLIAIKVFNTADPTAARRNKGVDLLDQRMDTLRDNYQVARELNMSCAEILNEETFKTDGCILQEYTKPVEVTWNQRNTLSDEETVLIKSFCDALGKAMMRPDIEAWDLLPKNFGKDMSTGTLKLFDFSDERFITSQWDDFDKAIRNWVGNNSEAKSIVREKLTEMAASPTFAQHKDEIEKIINRIVI